VVLGRARVRGMPPQFWLWLGVLVSAFAVGYWYWAQRELAEAKSRVLGKQRAVEATLGPKIHPFRDLIETWTSKLAGPYEGDLVDDAASLERIQRRPGVYLRLMIDNARLAEDIRKNAARSLLDGFTSCLFVRSADADPTRGKACKSTLDCEPGHLCNEWDRCHQPPRPYNLRLAYRALRVLSDAWTAEVHQAASELAVTAYERDLDAATLTDVPVSIEVLELADYFTVVLDEAPASGLPEPLPDVEESREERVQRVEHFARVGVWDLESKKPVLRLRRRVAGRYVPVGKQQVPTPAVRAAQERQTLSCALALEVKRALADSRGP
jgi:hypothetical protein